MFVILRVHWNKDVVLVDVHLKKRLSHLRYLLMKDYRIPRTSRLLVLQTDDGVRELEDTQPLSEQGVVDGSDVLVREVLPPVAVVRKDEHMLRNQFFAGAPASRGPKVGPWMVLSKGEMYVDDGFAGGSTQLAFRSVDLRNLHRPLTNEEDVGTYRHGVSVSSTLAHGRQVDTTWGFTTRTTGEGAAGFLTGPQHLGTSRPGLHHTEDLSRGRDDLSSQRKTTGKVNVVVPLKNASSTSSIKAAALKVSELLTTLPLHFARLEKHLALQPEVLQQMLHVPAMQSLLNDRDFLQKVIESNPATKELLDAEPAFRAAVVQEGVGPLGRSSLKAELSAFGRWKLDASDQGPQGTNHQASIISDIPNDRRAGSQSQHKQIREDFRNPSILQSKLAQTEECIQKVNAAPGSAQHVGELFKKWIEPYCADNKSFGALEVEDLYVASTAGAALDGLLGHGAGDRNDRDGAAIMKPKNQMSKNINHVLSVEKGMRSTRPRKFEASKHGLTKIEEESVSLGTTTDETAAGDRLDGNAVASLLQDPNLQALLASYMETTERRSAFCTSFSNPAFVAALFNPTNMQALPVLESFLGKTSRFADRFGDFLQANAHNPENVYRSQLAKLRNTGFHDTAANIAALEKCDGKVHRAIEILLLQQAFA
ncbi:unnamed protein product [Amoebophrya sp. A25]|nr:unnamed protein product [Amoebophrya sp. A25]|eukprot:GSA25T00026948001.1